ncbi:hypothetical protein ZOSMA_7G01040 [Zostera marina]|uniref:Reticulon-like protein n=1 Tax=Zostera marina TaxID=29655 RepID=A0A0K9NMS0_ZOSMR|nr:hypothetical protein ZOSMA_7G01040 [Zostera marina]
MDPSCDDDHRLIDDRSLVHQLFGGGMVADIILWRRRDLTLQIVVWAISAWLIFQVSGHTLIYLVSRVLLLVLSILFVWAKAAGVLNRPPPPIPKMYLSEETVNELATFARANFNDFFSASYDVALGKNPILFYKVASCLWILSVLGAFFDFITIGYTGLLLILTLPVLYDKYEYQICHYSVCACRVMYQGLKDLSRFRISADDLHYILLYLRKNVRADIVLCRLRKKIVFYANKFHKWV